MATSTTRSKDQTSFRCIVFDPPNIYGNLVAMTEGWNRLPTMDCTVITLAVTFPGTSLIYNSGQGAFGAAS